LPKDELVLKLTVDGGDCTCDGLPDTLVIPMPPRRARELMRRIKLVASLKKRIPMIYKVELWDYSVQAQNRGEADHVSAPTMSVDGKNVWWTVSDRHTGIYLSTEGGIVTKEKLMEFANQPQTKGAKG